MRRMQRAFADHLRHVGRMCPKEHFKRVVLTIDNAPWHRGKLIGEALKENPHLESYRMPGYSPRSNVIERFWKKLRHRATHDRLFDTIADLKESIRAGLCYFQTIRGKILTSSTVAPRNRQNDTPLAGTCMGRLTRSVRLPPFRRKPGSPCPGTGCAAARSRSATTRRSSRA